MCQLTAAHSFNMHLTEHVRESRWPLLSILSLCLRESIQGGRESQACRWGVSTSSVWGILLNSSFRWPHIVLRMTLGARWCNYAILSSFCGLGNRHKVRQLVTDRAGIWTQVVLTLTAVSGWWCLQGMLRKEEKWRVHLKMNNVGVSPRV